jgi:hypothetical protein
MSCAVIRKFSCVGHSIDRLAISNCARARFVQDNNIGAFGIMLVISKQTCDAKQTSKLAY